MTIVDAHADVKAGMLKTGRTPARSDARTPSLLNIVRDTGLKIPASVSRSKKVTQEWGIMGNDKYGDCDFAMWAHALMSMDADNGLHWTPMAQTVINAYFQYTGGADQGTNMLESSNLRLKETWANFGQKKADFFVGLDLGTRMKASVQAAVYLVGSASLGVGLPLALQKTPYDWTKLPDEHTLATDPTWKPGSWGGHAVPALDYDSHGVTILTWGKLVKVSWAMLAWILDEGYAVSHPNFRNRKGKTPTGLTLAMVKKYLPTAA